jgi:hypothetical protein
MAQTMDLESVRRTIGILNEKIRPIAERPVAFGRDLLQRLSELPDPLTEAGVREKAEDVLAAVVDLYFRSNGEEREEIREMFRINRAFAWAATFGFPPDSPERFRQHLIRFSIIDQGTDARDAVLWLAALCAPSIGIDENVVASIRREVAALSSDVDRYGFGSTRDLMLRGYGNYGRYGAPQP